MYYYFITFGEIVQQQSLKTKKIVFKGAINANSPSIVV